MSAASSHRRRLHRAQPRVNSQQRRRRAPGSRPEASDTVDRKPQPPSIPHATGSPTPAGHSPSMPSGSAEFDASADPTIQAARRAMEAAFQSLPVFSGQSEREKERDRRAPRADPHKNARRERQKWEQRLERTRRARGGIPGLAQPETASTATPVEETVGDRRGEGEEGFVLRFPRQPGQPSHAVGREAVRVWNDGSAVAKWPTGAMAVSVNVDDHATQLLRRSGSEGGTMYRIMATVREAGQNRVVVYFDPYGEGSVTSPRGVVRLACSADGSGYEADEEGQKVLEWDEDGTVRAVACRRESRSGRRPSPVASSVSAGSTVAAATSALDSIVLPGMGGGTRGTGPSPAAGKGAVDGGVGEGKDSHDGTEKDGSIRSIRRLRVGKHLGVTYDLDTRTVRVYFDCKGVQHMFVQGFNPPRRTIEPGRSLFGDADPVRAAREARQKEKENRDRNLEKERRREQREERRRQREAAAAEAEALANPPASAKKPRASRERKHGPMKSVSDAAPDAAPSAEPDPEHSQYLRDIRSTVGGLLEGMQQMTKVAEMQRRLEELGE